jgi:hypothetical protein
MKLNTVVWAAIYEDGQIADGHESSAIGSKEWVKLVIESTSRLKNDLEIGKLTLKQVKVVLFN